MHGAGSQLTGESYAFEGKVIPLNQADYDRWQKTYRAIPDLHAKLVSIDAWLADQPEEKRRKWFHATAGMLNRNHQDRLATTKQPAAQPAPRRSLGRQVEPDELASAMACANAITDRAASGGYGPFTFPTKLKLVS